MVIGMLGTTRRRAKKQSEEAADDPGTEWPNYRSPYPQRNTNSVQPVSPWSPSNNISRSYTAERSTSFIPLTPTTTNTSNRTDAKTLQSRAPIPRDRLAFHQALAGTGPVNDATDLPSRAPSYSQIQPPTILPPASVARADGRHPSVVLGGASRPGTPPPTYDDRHNDELHHVSNGRAPEVMFDQDGSFSAPEITWASRR